ncbi:hypothetical protein SFRURICE_005931, partial [Spodoptera frugiperda]
RFSTRDVLCYVAVDAFDLALVETDSAKLDACYGWLPYYRYIAYSSCSSSLDSYIAHCHCKWAHSFIGS